MATLLPLNPLLFAVVQISSMVKTQMDSVNYSVTSGDLEIIKICLYTYIDIKNIAV